MSPKRSNTANVSPCLSTRLWSLSRADDDTDGLLYEDQRWSWREVVEEAQVRAELLTQLRGPGPFHIGVLLENVHGSCRITPHSWKNWLWCKNAAASHASCTIR